MQNNEEKKTKNKILTTTNIDVYKLELRKLCTKTKGKNQATLLTKSNGTLKAKVGVL